MKKVGIIFGMIVLVYFALSGITSLVSTVSVADAITNPGDTFQLLWAKITQNEAKIAELEERIAELEEGQGTSPQEINIEDYPYFAKLAPELEEKVEVRYKWAINSQSDPATEFYYVLYVDIVFSNISTERIDSTVLTHLPMDVLCKDGEGTLLFSCQRPRLSISPSERPEYLNPGDSHIMGTGFTLYEWTEIAPLVKTVELIVGT